MNKLETELKNLIIEVFDLEGLSVDDIDSEAPLFDSGLGLDSIDALELGLALKTQYAIKIDVETAYLDNHFDCVTNLAQFVAKEQVRDR